MHPMSVSRSHLGHDDLSDRPPARKHKGQARYAVLPELGGVEMLRARFTTHHFSRHFHEGYALGIIEDGALGFRYRGAEVTAPRGAVNLVVPGEAHNGYAAADQGWSYRMLYLPADLVRRVAAQGDSRDDHGGGNGTVGRDLPFFASGVLDDADLARRVHAVHRLLEAPDAPLLEKEIKLHSLVATWIDRHADRAVPWPRPGNEHGAVRRAREYLHANLERDVALAELARAAHLSPFHLARVFESETGIPPHAYLIQIRLARAKEMLGARDTGHRIADIAAATGFADQSHLTRLFKRRYGVTPGAFRKIVQTPHA